MLSQLMLPELDLQNTNDQFELPLLGIETRGDVEMNVTSVLTNLTEIAQHFQLNRIRCPGKTWVGVAWGLGKSKRGALQRKARARQGEPASPSNPKCSVTALSPSRPRLPEVFMLMPRTQLPSSPACQPLPPLTTLGWLKHTLLKFLFKVDVML